MNILIDMHWLYLGPMKIQIGMLHLMGPAKTLILDFNSLRPMAKAISQEIPLLLIQLPKL